MREGPHRRVARRRASMVRAVEERDFRAHARFRHALRRFLRFSELRAREAGLTAAQHQLLLAVRGSPRGWLTVGEVARTLLVRPHSAAGLAERAVAAGLVAKCPDPDDQRRVRVVVTPRGEEIITRLTGAHRVELVRLWRRIPAPK